MNHRRAVAPSTRVRPHKLLDACDCHHAAIHAGIREASFVSRELWSAHGQSVYEAIDLAYALYRRHLYASVHFDGLHVLIPLEALFADG